MWGWFIPYCSTTHESLNERQPCTVDGKVYITADARIDGREALIQQLQGEGLFGY